MLVRHFDGETLELCPASQRQASTPVHKALGSERGTFQGSLNRGARWPKAVPPLLPGLIRDSRLAGWPSVKAQPAIS